MSGKEYSSSDQFVADMAAVFTHSGSLETRRRVVATLLNALTNIVGTETEAREIMAETPEVAALLPKRERGHPADPIQQDKDAALLQVCDWLMAEGKSVRAAAYYIHEKHGIGSTGENLRRKLHALRAKRDATEQN